MRSKSNARRSLTALRIASFLEGLSWLVLLFIAMPLKYLANEPSMVTHVGRVHGGLFCVFVLLLCVAWWFHRRWSRTAATLLFSSSLVPFGFLWAEKWLRRQAR